MWKEERLRHWLAFVMDLAYAVSGVLAIMFPSKAITGTDLPPWAVVVWGSFYIGGGLICATGVLLRQPAFRFVGLPLLVSASAMYGSALLFYYHYRAEGTYLFLGVFLIATAMGLADRWLVVSRRFHVVREGSRG